MSNKECPVTGCYVQGEHEHSTFSRPDPPAGEYATAEKWKAALDTALAAQHCETHDAENVYCPGCMKAESDEAYAQAKSDAGSECLRHCDEARDAATRATAEACATISRTHGFDAARIIVEKYGLNREPEK